MGGAQVPNVSARTSATPARPTISVIIVTYNYAQYIATTIESVLDQTLRPDEILVVDDGSTDNTDEVVAGYINRGVRYLYKANGGISSARNVGIQETTGTLIAFLDSDDYWLPDKLARQVDYLRRHPDVAMVTGSEWQASDPAHLASGEAWRLDRKPAGAVQGYHRMLVENWIGNASLVLVRREVFSRAGLFDEGVGLGQDWDLWIRIARVTRIGVIKAPLIVYRRHEGSVSSGQVWRRMESNRRTHSRYISGVRSPIARVRIGLSARSMNFYYTGASLLEGVPGEPRRKALPYALGAALFDPFYNTRLKAGLLLHAILGEGAFKRLSGYIRKVRG